MSKNCWGVGMFWRRELNIDRESINNFGALLDWVSYDMKNYASVNWNPVPRPPRHSPRGAVELTRCLFHPGHKRGYNAHAFLEEGTARENCILLFLRNSSLRASTPFEICGSVKVSRSSIIVFLNLGEWLQCSDKVTGIFISTQKCKCMHLSAGINVITVRIKATTFGHARHHVNIVRLRFAVYLSWRKVARGYPEAIFKISRISSRVLFQVLRVDFLTLVFPSLVFLGPMCAHNDRIWM